MATIGTNTIWEVQTGGDDTNNGGGFDPAQNAGMFTDGAATSATGNSPVFSSASYNFVAGDVGAWVYVSSGTNWTPGWYQIASVASNNATLTATVGTAVLKQTYQPSTAAGCATTGSPTGATWSIDYSQQAVAQFTYTDLASVGAGLTVSSVAQPFGKQHVGNCIVITGGTNFTAGRYIINSVAAGVATVAGAANMTTGAGVSGTGGMGGAYASPGKAGAAATAGNWYYIKTGSYSITSASTNVAGGCLLTNSGGQSFVFGYGTVRGDLVSPPTLTASGISTATLINMAGNAGILANLICDGASLTSIRGFYSNTQWLIFYKLTAKNCTNSGISMTSANSRAVLCSATGCSTQPAILAFEAYYCEAYANTVTGFGISASGFFTGCISSGNTGASSDGFAQTGGNGFNCTNSVAYGNGRDGFHGGSSVNDVFLNCIAEANGAYGFNTTTNSLFISCATYNNTSGSWTSSMVRGITFAQAIIAGSGSFFTNAASGDFSLNNTAGAGALLRATATPGLFPRGTTTGYLDIGAAQHADPAASGESVAIFGG